MQDAQVLEKNLNQKIRTSRFKQDRYKAGWEGWGGFLDTGNITEKSAYYEFRELEDLINELPPNPAVVYAPYWKSWDDFLLYYND